MRNENFKDNAKKFVINIYKIFMDDYSKLDFLSN